MRGLRGGPLGPPPPRGPPPMGLLGPAPHPSGPGAAQRELISVPTAGMGNVVDDGSGAVGVKRSHKDAEFDEVSNRTGTLNKVLRNGSLLIGFS